MSQLPEHDALDAALEAYYDELDGGHYAERYRMRMQRAIDAYEYAAAVQSIPKPVPDCDHRGCQQVEPDWIVERYVKHSVVRCDKCKAYYINRVIYDGNGGIASFTYHKIDRKYPEIEPTKKPKESESLLRERIAVVLRQFDVEKIYNKAKTEGKGPVLVANFHGLAEPFREMYLKQADRIIATLEGVIHAN